MAAYQAPLSLGFSRQEHRSGLPFPSSVHESEREVTQSCLTLCDPMDCSLQGSFAHGIFQTRLLEWGAIAFSEERSDWKKERQKETPGVTGKFGLGMRIEAGQRLIEFFQENALVIANSLFQQHNRRFYTWTSPDGQHRNQIDYILCSRRWRSSIQSTKTRLGADCGSDHELLITKFRLKLKKIGKTARPFRYDLN